MRGRRPVLTAAILLGLGLGGFVDGILLHQVLQWHHMLSSHDHHPTTTLAGLESNVFADGLFHVGTWIATVIGIGLLWRARTAPVAHWSTRVLIGGMAMGWGVFNLTEGIVNHHVLAIHHVRDDLGAPLSWDLGFLASGVVLVAAGWLLARSAPLPQAEAHRATSPSG